MNQLKKLNINIRGTRKLRIVLIFIIIGLFYLGFPVSYSYWDAYSYAAQVKYEIDMFQPHHLLYNPTIWLVDNFIAFLDIDVDIILLGKYLNGIFQLFNIIISYYILRLLNVKNKTILGMLLVLAFSFNPWRFGTENETYIMPITFSLLGSYQWLRFCVNKRNYSLVLSGLFGAIACLYHQIHFFWWVGILIGIVFQTKSLKKLILYSLPALLVPLFYLLVIKFYLDQSLTQENILHFIFRDFYRGTVSSAFGLKSVFLQIASTVRTFFQVHPIIITLISKNSVYILPIIISFYFVLKILPLLWKRKALKRLESVRFHIFGYVHFGILISQFLVAFYNMGNVEFMVMIPFLLVIALSIFYKINKIFLRYFVMILFVWNFSFGILPYHKYKFYDDDKLVQFIAENPKANFVVKSLNIKAKYFYLTGKDKVERIKLVDKLSSVEIKDLVSSDVPCYTDVIEYPEIFNKEKLMSSESMTSKFKDLQAIAIFSYGGLFGETKVKRLKLKNN